MKRKLTALLLATSFFAAGSAYAADYKISYAENGYSSGQIGQVHTWNSPPDMDPNIAPIVITMGRMFGTWVAKNHKSVWAGIVGYSAMCQTLATARSLATPRLTMTRRRQTMRRLTWRTQVRFARSIMSLIRPAMRNKPAKLRATMTPNMMPPRKKWIFWKAFAPADLKRGKP